MLRNVGIDIHELNAVTPPHISRSDFPAVGAASGSKTPCRASVVANTASATATMFEATPGLSIGHAATSSNPRVPDGSTSERQEADSTHCTSHVLFQASNIGMDHAPCMQIPLDPSTAIDAIHAADPNGPGDDDDEDTVPMSRNHITVILEQIEVDDKNSLLLELRTELSALAQRYSSVLEHWRRAATEAKSKAAQLSLAEVQIAELSNRVKELQDTGIELAMIVRSVDASSSCAGSPRAKLSAPSHVMPTEDTCDTVGHKEKRRRRLDLDAENDISRRWQRQVRTAAVVDTQLCESDCSDATAAQTSVADDNMELPAAAGNNAYTNDSALNLQHLQRELKARSLELDDERRITSELWSVIEMQRNEFNARMYNISKELLEAQQRRQSQLLRTSHAAQIVAQNADGSPGMDRLMVPARHASAMVNRVDRHELFPETGSQSRSSVLQEASVNSGGRSSSRSIGALSSALLQTAVEMVPDDDTAEPDFKCKADGSSSANHGSEHFDSGPAGQLDCNDEDSLGL